MSRISHIAIFDLDKTLTRRDTLLPYLFGFLARRPWRVFRVLHLPVATVLFLFGAISNARLKEIFVTAFLAGSSREQIQRWSNSFLDKLIAHGFRKDGIETLNQHISASDHTILLSASLDIYVHELGKRLGFSETICTRVEWKSGRLTGRLATANRHGPEKLKCFEKLREMYPDTIITAYADDHSDIELLRRANNGILVNGSRKACRKAYGHEISCQTWRG